MDKKTLLTTLTITVFLFPTPGTAGPCFDQAKKFGKGHDKSDQAINPECIQKVMDQAANNARSLSESGKIQAFGFANVLVIKQLNPLIERTIAGSSTELENIKATAVDDTNKEVFVYDDVKKSVFVFTTAMGGNLAPKRTLKFADLTGVVGLAVDSKHNELFVALEKEVAVFSRLANAQGQRPENSQKEFRRLSGTQTGLSRISGITIQKEQLLISEKNTVFVFETSAKGDTPPIEKFKQGIQ